MLIPAPPLTPGAFPSGMVQGHVPLHAPGRGVNAASRSSSAKVRVGLGGLLLLHPAPHLGYSPDSHPKYKLKHIYNLHPNSDLNSNYNQALTVITNEP